MDANSVTGAIKSTYSMMTTKAARAGAGAHNIGSHVANFKIPLMPQAKRMAANGTKW